MLIVISAPSGGGKTTLCQKLLEADSGITRAVTCTTRAPRAGEKEGVDYHFLDRQTFLKKVEAGEFLEHADVYGNLYGNLKSSVLDKLRNGCDVLLNIDVQGAATIRKKAKGDAELSKSLVSVFLTPPTLAILEERLKRRGTDSPEVIAHRLESARGELAQWSNFDYLILSGPIDEDLRKMLAILEAERMGTQRIIPPDFGQG